MLIHTKFLQCRLFLPCFRGGAVGGGVCADCELEICSNVFVELPPQRCCGLTALLWGAKAPVVASNALPRCPS